MNKVFCGIDLGTRSSSFCVVDGDKAVIQRWSGSNCRLIENLEKLEGKLHCVVEACPLAESICEKVEEIGATMEVVDSRHTKALLHGKKKTDRIDAQVLAELACNGWYKPIHRKGGKLRAQRTVVHGRHALVKVNTQLKNTIRGLLKASGIVLPLGADGAVFVKKVLEAVNGLPCEVRETFKELLAVWEDVDKRQRAAYRRLRKLAAADTVAKRLMTVPGVGPATALSFSAAISTPARFPDGKQVAGYLGLAPRVHQSGDTHYHGRITKQGDKLTRWLLIEAANSILTRVRKSFPLKEWGMRLAQRKGQAKAKVAVARRLAVLLFTLWKTESEFLLQHA